MVPEDGAGSGSMGLALSKERRDQKGGRQRVGKL